MTQGSLIQRMRTGDIRSVPVLVWPLLGLALLDAYLVIGQLGVGFDDHDVPSIVLTIAPFLCAAVIAFRALPDRRFLWGALALCVLEITTLLSFVIGPADDPAGFGLGTVLALVGQVSTLAGLLLIGSALGGVRSRTGRLAVGLGVAASLVSAASYLWDVSTLPAEGLELYVVSALSILGGLTASAVYIGWGYLLGVSLESRARFTAAGAGLSLGLAAYGIAFTWLLSPAPGTDFTITNFISLALQILVWLALIAAATTEFGATREPRSEPATAAEAPA